MAKLGFERNPVGVRTMKSLAAGALLLATATAAAQGTHRTAPDGAVARFGSIPLGFEPNRGQTSANVQWLAHGPEYAIFLAGHDAVLEMNRTAVPRIGDAPKISSSAIRMNLLGARDAIATSGEGPLTGKTNYFTGRDQAKWQRDVPTFGKVRLREVYPGIDLVYYGRQGQLEYDFVVASGADASAIRLHFDGATARLADNGDLLLPVDGTDTEVRFNKPVVYQMKEGKREPVAGEFRIAKEDRQVSFTLGQYDRGRQLVIDPTLLFTGVIATGNQQTVPTGMTVDAAGEIFLTGYTNDLTFPVTSGAFQTTCSKPTDPLVVYGGVRCGVSSSPSAFVTKIAADGTSLIYSTYLHGGGGYEQGQSIAVDSAGDAYVLGATSSNDFPITSDAYQSLCQPIYQLLSFYPVAVYGPLQAQCDNFYNGGGTEYTVNGPNLFISKLDPTGSALLYSTFFGGGGAVYPIGIALDGANNIYFASSANPGFAPGQLYPNNDRGETQFPLTTNAYQTTGIGLQEPAISKLSADGHTLLYSTFLGSTTAGQSNASYATALTLGQSGIAYIGGYTQASDFPTTAGSLKPSCTLNPSTTLNCSNAQGFVAEIDTTKAGAASLVYSTYLGGNQAQASNIPEQQVSGLATDANDNLYVTGYTYADDFPTTAGVYQPSKVIAGGAESAFVTKIDPTGSAIVWSTFLGGQTVTGTAPSTGNAIALDTKGRVYLEGFSQDGGGDFPQVNPLEGYSSGNKIVIAAFSADASQLLFSTRFSGTNTNSLSASPIANGIAVDGTGNIYFAGYTNDGGNYGTTAGTYATTATNGFNRPLFGKISSVLPSTTTSLTVAPVAASTVGQNVTFSVGVTGGGSATTLVPAGTVTLTNTAVTPASLLATVILDGTGKGTFSTNALTAGSYIISAAYGGGSNFDVSVSSPLAFIVTAAPTATAVMVSAASIAPGASETLTAVVTGGFPAPVLTGIVTFSDQNGALGIGTVSGGSAALALTTLSSGVHRVLATYSGDVNYSTSSSVAQNIIVLSPTTTSLAISAAAIDATQPETLTATIALTGGSSTSPTGTVAFADQRGSLGTSTVTAGVATISLTTLPVATHRITATYGGDANFLPSTSAPQSVVVTLASQTIAFPAIPNHLVGDPAFTLNATATSGLAVSYTLVSGPATLAGGSVTVTGMGTVAIQATQAGNTVYAAATPVTQSFVVSFPLPTLASIAPTLGIVGSGATAVTLTGTNFATTDTVLLNGNAVPSTFVSSTSLTAALPSSLFAAAGTGSIAVADSASRTATAPATFTVVAAPAIVFTGPTSAASGAQPVLTFTLTNPYPYPLDGVLNLAFAPVSTAGLADDPTVQFATGGRTIDFAIPANSTSTPPVQLQTGTIAGIATVTLAVSSDGVNVTPSNVAPVAITVSATVPQVSSTKVLKSGKTLTLAIVGFSNTRELTKAVFHFTPVPGSSIADPDVSVDVGTVFAAWYASSQSDAYGSAFTYTQPFTLDSDASTIQGVTVTLTNTIGISTVATAQ